ncbi:MAG: hypothetical protein GY866_29055 [Proteobacteria bacterium]|nr:hypothetical protein [Pseudomonadota bacterium]
MKSETKFLRDREYIEGNELSDPSYFNPLIAEQKKNLKNNRGDPEGWVKLGSLYEERASLTHRIAHGSFILRNSHLLTSLIVFPFALFLYATGLHRYFLDNNPWLFASLMSGMALGIVGLFFFRYPRSGSRFFKKAAVLDPKCGEAYMHLGFIALRRFRKRKACRLLEHALQLNVDDTRIKKELKTIYEREFVGFFNTQKEEEKKKQDVIDRQLEQIKKLLAKQHILETNTAILKARMKQTRSQVTRKIKTKAREMDGQMADFSLKYREKMAEIDKEKTALAENKDIDPVIYVNLNDELFESEPNTAHFTFHQAVESAKSSFELELWQSLSRLTKIYLVTAEQTLSLFSRSGDIKDFGLIGLEYCKALELEVNRRFVAPFVDYLGKDKAEFLKTCRIGVKKNKPKYYGYLPMVVDENNYPGINSLTLGQFHFSLDRSLKNDYILNGYRQFINGVLSDNQKPTILLLKEKLGVVVKRYRNAIAHRSSMNREECEHLRELVFSGKDSLLRICAMAQPVPQHRKLS